MTRAEGWAHGGAYAVGAGMGALALGRGPGFVIAAGIFGIVVGSVLQFVQRKEAAGDRAGR